MKEFITRSLSAVVFGILILGSLLLDNIAFAAVIFLVNILGLREFYLITGDGKIRPHQISGIILGSIVYLVITEVAGSLFPPIITSKSLLLFSLLPLLFLVFIVELFSVSGKPLANIANAILGVIYISVPLALLNWINAFSNHFALAVFVLIWVNDTFAYISGVLAGKHPLFKRVSPKKTWEGSIGGALFALLGTYVFYACFPELSLVQWLVFGLIIVIFASLGDLSESMFKRSLHIKDSGNIMPGHGGILDRFDATLMTAPFIFFYLLLIG